VVLYLVRLRRRVVVVPFVALFRDALPDERTTRLFTRLRNLLSLLLALVIAALIAFGLGLPEWARLEGPPRTAVFVLDGTASMQALLGDGRSRFEHARAEALERLDALGPGDRAIVLLAGPEARVLHPLDEDLPSVARALRAATPTDAPGGADEALAWASALCAREGDAPDGAPADCVVHVLTDGGLPGLAEAVEALRAEGVQVELAIARDEEDAPPAANLAITALSARRFPTDPTRAEVIVEVTSAAPEAARVVLEIAADGALAHREILTLEPGASVARALDDVGAADAILEARLLSTEGPAARLDALAVDDVAFASLPPRRRRRVLVVREEASSGQNTYLDAALLLDPYLDVVTTTPAAYEASGAPVDREAVIFDGWAPRTPPRLPSLLLAPGASEPAWLPSGETLARPRFDMQLREHPLLAFLALRDVNIATARTLVPGMGDEVVGGEARGALLTTGQREGVRFVALGFDVRDSDLPLRIAWPILVLNTLAFLVPDDVAVLEGARTGRPFRLEARGDAAPWLRLRGAPEAAAIPGALRGDAALYMLERVGIYDVVEAPDGLARAGDEPGRVVVASLLDRDESRLRAAAIEGAARIAPRAHDVSSGGGTADEDARSERPPLYTLVVALALALLALEWLTFHRRWTT
jgi:hypothetical protein